MSTTERALREERDAQADAILKYVEAQEPSEFDAADLIAGRLGCSRGFAYTMMERALADRYSDATPPVEAQEQPAGELPHPGSPEASAMMDSVLSEYGWPSNAKNAARAGWTAAMRWLARPQAVPSPTGPRKGEPPQPKPEAVGEECWFAHLDALVDIWYDGNYNAPDDRCYAPGALKDAMLRSKAAIDANRAAFRAPETASARSTGEEI